MTDRDELRTVIAEILAEQTRQHGYAKRDPLVAFSDPDGKSWYSATVSKLQALLILFAVVAGLVGGITGGVRLFVLPEVRDITSVSEAQHHARVTAEFATKRELDREIARVELSGEPSRAEVKVLQDQVVTLKQQTARIEEKLDRLLARGR
jgi:uncharacterized protein YdcH (DUF465 family)